MNLRTRILTAMTLAAFSLTVGACTDEGTPNPAVGGVTQAPEDQPDVDGTYVVTYTEQDYADAGIKDQALIDENVGEFTWTLSDGEWSYSQVSPTAQRTEESGTYELAGDTMTFLWQPATITMQVEKADDGSLVFTDVEDAVFEALSEVQFGLHRWTPVS